MKRFIALFLVFFLAIGISAAEAGPRRKKRMKRKTHTTSSHAQKAQLKRTMEEKRLGRFKESLPKQ